MSTPEQRPILLAVEDGPAATASLDFAVAEAVRTQADLHLLHVVHRYPTNSEEFVVGRQFIGPAQQMLADLAKQAGDRASGAPFVSTEVTEGPVVGTIVARSHQARMVVLQGEDSGRLARMVTGQVRNGVASRAAVPVVCVPPGWNAGHVPSSRIVVGIDDAYNAEDLVRAALEAVADRGRPIRFLSTWWFAEPYDDVIFTAKRTREWTKETERVLRARVDEVARDYASVDTEVVARHQRPADALVDESRRASLLVIGRRDPRLPRGSHIGPIARAVLGRSECPVMVLEPAS